MAGHDKPRATGLSTVGTGTPILGYTRAHTPLQTIGKYEVLEVIGHGGMGVVYRARDNAIGRHVALKVMGAALAQQGELRERFLREARAAGNLQHPNIVVIYDLGE